MTTRTRRAPAELKQAPDEGDEQLEITTLDELRNALAADERPIERVRVPEWAGSPTFYLRALTGRDRDAIENSTMGDGINDISAKIVARALCTPDGKQLVPRTAAGIAEAERMLSARTAGGLLRLMRAARRLSKLDQQAVDELEAMLAAGPTAPSGAHGTD